MNEGRCTRLRKGQQATKHNLHTWMLFRARALQGVKNFHRATHNSLGTELPLSPGGPARSVVTPSRQGHSQVDSGDEHGTAIRNRLAVRIAGSHPADRGSIPRYGMCTVMVYSLNKYGR